MRILHTSDWHLGHTLHSRPREREHARFLEWLLDTLERERIDVLLVAGDIFDAANPPAAAQTTWYGFLATAQRRVPGLQVVAIGGNHDSAARLDAISDLVRPLRVTVVGGLPRTPDGAIDFERVVVPLTDWAGRTIAWAAAVPFLRPADLGPISSRPPVLSSQETAGPISSRPGLISSHPPIPSPREIAGPISSRPPTPTPTAPGGHPPDPPRRLASLGVGALRAERSVAVLRTPSARNTDQPTEALDDELVQGVRRVYDEVLAFARTRRQAGQAIVALGHCYMTGTRVSELSERKILGGNQHALPLDLFPDDVAYVALGHLHLAQSLGGREGVRYSGSPIPLALDEEGYPHQVCVVEIEGDARRSVRTIPIPRTVPILRLPADGPRPLAEVLGVLRALEDRPPDFPEEDRPFLEVRVTLERPEPRLKQILEEAVAGKTARLVRIAPPIVASQGAIHDSAPPGAALEDLSIEDVFARRWARDHEGAPPRDLLALLHEIVEQVRREEVRAS